ncbi:MAG: DUF2851 family protein [Lentimicrobium sp.]|nr:DUF2851 family protein [Lentimicrobium sp.]
MNEEFLHYLWKYKLLNKSLQTLEGEQIRIISPGIHNLNAGPDFFDARLQIGNTVWAGNVEIHINSSDWTKHGHHKDPAYDNVVLHAVYNHDVTDSNQRIPVFELKGCFDENLFSRYRDFLNSRLWVPCATQVSSAPETEIILWLERMLIERLENKSDLITGFLELGKSNWEEALYYTLARSFGFNVNNLPFEMLARSLPYKIIARHSDNPFQVEALIFGQSGLLTEEVTDRWAQELFNEYAFLRKKYQLIPIQKHLWKFMRLRPGNFPTIRLSQFAALFCTSQSLLSRILESTTSESLIKLFNGVEASSYWNNHYMFDKDVTFRKKTLGKEAVKLLMINAVLPFMFVYGRSLDNDNLCNRALDIFNKLPGEKNTITHNWKKYGLDVSTAFNTQALIGMKKEYCDKKRCLDCRIGDFLLRKESDQDSL